MLAERAWDVLPAPARSEVFFLLCHVCVSVCVCVRARAYVCVCVCSSMDLYDTWYVSAYVFVSHSLRTEIRINTGSGARAGAQLLR